MSGAFPEAWLALREAADHRSRSDLLAGRLARWCRQRGSARVLDLGCGAGSNLRYLAPRLGPQQRWRLLDVDGTLLAHAVTRVPEGIPLVAQCRDLSSVDAGDLGGTDVVTGSALLDLLDPAQLRQLVDAISTRGCAALFALSVNGRVRLSPAHRDDAAIGRAFNAHQRRRVDGRALLGPDAAGAAATALRAAGYAVVEVATPWRLAVADASLTGEWLDGWIAAAIDADPSRQADFESARQAHAQALDEGRLQVEVGHVDLLALPPEAGRLA